MSPEKFFSFIVTFGRLIALILIIVGCAYQTWGVIKEYFEYQTNTKLSVQDYDEEVLAPSIVLCMRFEIDPRVESRIGKLFASDFFRDGNNSWRIFNVTGKNLRKKNLDYDVRKFIRHNRYCMLIKVRDKFRMEEVISPRFGTTPFFYTYIVTLEPFFSENGYLRNPKCLLKQFYFQVVTDETLTNKANHFYVYDVCTENKDSFRSRITYLYSVNIKLPPPYDSDCLDYRTSEGHFLSSHECFDECLRKKIKIYGVVPAASVIDRQKYEKSDYLRTMDIAPASIVEDRETLALLKTKKHLPENHKKKNITIWRTIPERLFETYQTVNKKWEEINNACKKDCHRPDCVYERITPHLSFIEEIARKNTSSYFPTLRIRARPSDQPITKVTWVPKQQLLDCIIYVLSGISFWVGFCPLAVMDNAEAWARLKLDQWLKKRRPKRIPKRILERIPKRILERIPKRIPKRIPERRIRLNQTDETGRRRPNINHEWYLSQYTRNTVYPRQNTLP